MSEKSLNVAEGVDLPLAVVGQKLAILGMSGCGKSNAARRLCEQMHRHGAPWVAIDPKGDWHGVRSNRDGSGQGLNVPILGGDFGDMPLSPDHGKRLGELVAAGQFKGVLDISNCETDSQKSRFVADFGRALLRNCRTPVMVFCDEAQDYMPQPGAGGRLDGPAADCVNVWKQVANKGRFKGIGFTLCSQRVALLNKTCLYQCETLIAMRVQGARDKASIKDYVSDLGDATEILRSLSTLEDGEAWIFSPQRLKITRRVKFLLQETFDSGRTPEVGKSLKSPKLADVDLSQLRSLLAVEPEPGEKPKGGQPSADVERLRAGLDATWVENSRLIAKITRLEATIDAVRAAIGSDFTHTIEVKKQEVSPAPAPMTSPSGTEARGREKRSVAPSPQVDGLGKGETKTLAALAQHHPNGCTRSQLTILTGYKRSSRDTYLQRLKAAGMVGQQGERLTATKSGLTVVAGVERLPTGRALLQHWIANLPAGEARMLDVLSERKGGFSRDELSERTGYKRSSRDTYLQRLGARELIVVSGGMVELAETLRGSK